MSTAIQVTSKSLQQAGETIVVTVLRMGNDESMTVADVAELIGVTAAGLRGMIRDHSLIVCIAHDDQMEQLKQLGVVPLKSARANLLPKATIQALVKIVNTPEAWAAYNQLWVDAAGPKATADDVITKLAQATKQSADVVMLLNDQVSAIAIVVQQGMNDSTLSAVQLNELQRAIYRGAGRLGFKPGWFMGQIKTRWIPEKLRSGRTWKEISQADYAAALDFCNTHEPANWR